LIGKRPIADLKAQALLDVFRQIENAVQTIWQNGKPKYAVRYFDMPLLLEL
jgi:hypothetical protein